MSRPVTFQITLGPWKYEAVIPSLGERSEKSDKVWVHFAVESFQGFELSLEFRELLPSELLDREKPTSNIDLDGMPG